MANNIWLDASTDWNSASNWSLGAAPVTGDAVYIESGSKVVVTNLDQNAVTLASLNIAKNFVGSIGVSTASTNTPLKIGATVVNIGYIKGVSSPAGAALLNLNLHTAASTVRIYDSASAASDTTAAPIRIIANNASTNIHITGGSVEIAGRAGETATIGTLTQSQSSAKSSVVVGNIAASGGVTATTITINDGSAAIYCPPTTLNADGGVVSTGGMGAFATVANRGARLTLNATGTITALNCLAGETDLTRCDIARTVTTLTQYKGATVKRDKDIITVTTYTLGDNGAVTLSLS